MITAIKIILILAVLLLLSYPFIKPKGKKIRKLFVSSMLTYSAPHTRKNVFFVLLAIVEFIIAVFLFKIFDKLTQIVLSIPLIGKLLTKAIGGLNSQIDYIIFAIKMIVINLVVIYAFILLKAFLKKSILNPVFNIGKKKERFKFSSLFKKKNKGEKKDAAENGTDAEDSTESEDEKIRKRRRIPDFMHTMVEDDEEESDTSSVSEGNASEEKKQHGPLMSRFLSIFFEGDEFQFARLWVIRTRMILQSFIYLVEALYFLFIGITLVSVFFALPMPLYNLLINVLHVGEWYLYPAISLIFLQELCNIFDLPGMDEVVEDPEKEEEKKQDINRDARLRALLAELKKRFDAEHSLRYYPETAPREVPKYKCTNRTYASALDYIGKQMESSSGRIVHSYMECLDAIYNDMNVYFPASFYSEIGEYLIAYTYIRLLSGARMIFIVSEAEEKETLRSYVTDRLMKMTGSSAYATWRVCTANERLDQADVLIATPDDFREDNIVAQYPGFFEEASNAVFIDADKMIAMDSYLCPIIATRLKKATNNRIRFVFLSLDLLKGFAAKNLPKFFCLDKVLSFSSADENEAVSYVLWNKESKKHRIYNKNGQKSTCLEIIIAEQAFEYGIDGIRLISGSPLEHAEKQVLSLHNVEINNLYKDIVDVNYMIYSDDRCNLSAALYACTRFRGKKRSVVHIISKPYLLREYFMDKVNTEDYINRSSFIQPRATEHAENHKLSLLRIFCEVTAEDGLPVEIFERKMRSVIATQQEKQEDISSVFCTELVRGKTPEDLKLSELAAYLIAGLCDNDPFEVADDRKRSCVINSVGNRAKDFYLIVDPAAQDCYALAREKKIVFNRTKEVFDYVFACNKKVELRLNDEVIGTLDTFPSRVNLEYIKGQSIIYKNAEYEIEHIAKDGSAIYLRHENISIKNCLDTFLLRNYEINSLEQIGNAGVLNNSTSKLEEIRVSMCKADFSASTYGFYSLTTDRQTIDFYHGVEGNPKIDDPNTRRYSNGKVLRVSLKARMECTDGMRRLLAAVFNEFIRTIFPYAYRCVAICPILAEPELGEELEDNAANRIKTLYPFIKSPNEEFKETDPTRMQFLFINDCTEDIGVLNWFFDPSGRYMQEFLANVYSYLHWLKLRPGKSHYVYFGGDSLPECYDLDGCCELLGQFNLVLSDDGKKDFETAGDDEVAEKVEYCSFCHKPMESGRYSFFDKHRFICADCFETVDEKSKLEELYISMREYLVKTYPDITFGSAKVKFDPVYDLTLDQILSEFFYRMDFEDRTVYVEVDNPVNNVRVSLLRGIISLWQSDSALINQYAPAQLYYEELCYLRSIGADVAADWTYNELPNELRLLVDEISDYVNFKNEDAETEDKPEDTEGAEGEEGKDGAAEEAPRERRTSFSFMVLKGIELDSEDEYDNDTNDFDEEASKDLYDPNKVPRFWKRYLVGEHLDNGEEEDTSEAENETEEDEDDPVEVNASIFNMVAPNCPPPDTEDAEVTEEEAEESADETEGSDDSGMSEKERKKEEKKRQKEEKKRQREEKRRQRQLEWEQSLDKLDEEEEKKRKGIFEEEEKEEAPKKKKRGLFGFGKKKDEDAEETPAKDENKLDKSDDDGLDGDKNDGESGDGKVSEDETKDTEDKSEDGDNGTEEDKTEEDEPAKDEKKEKKKRDKKKNKKSLKDLFNKASPGEKILPYEEAEKTNPKIRVYNEMVRHAYNYSEEKFSREGVTDKDLRQIFFYVQGDYPELFWVENFCWTTNEVRLVFRCKDASDRLDVKQINKKREEIRKASKVFTKGITKKTDPYEAALTIYRRLILKLDYDSAGLNAKIDKDRTHDDVLRSLYGAIVEHKVVCAGYAVAMQYLLQTVGIVCGYVISELNATGNECHAFNILKIGKYCYYLDATWGDASNTLHGDYKDTVYYDYFCVPYNEFIKASPAQVCMHIPRRDFYPTLEKFNYTNHEYFRYHNAYLKSYNEQEIIRIFADAALAYNEEEMGRFTVGFRCADGTLAKHIYNVLMTRGKWQEILKKASARAANTDKKAAKLLDVNNILGLCRENTGTVYFFIGESKAQSKDKKKKK